MQRPLKATKGNVRLRRPRAKGPNGRSLSRFPQHDACLEVLLLPSGQGCKSISGLPPSCMSPVPIYLPIWVKRDKVDSEVPFLRKQRDGRGLNPGVRGVNRLATHTSTEEHQPNFKHMGEPNKAKGNQF